LARSGDVLQHPVTGERVVWRLVAGDTDGRLLRGDLYADPGGFVAAAHVHPMQEERFEVVAGRLKLRIGDEERILTAGDRAVVPAGIPHIWSNDGAEVAHVVGEFVPALRTEVFFETFFGLASDGKTNRKGLPNLLRMAVIMREYEDEIRLARPSARTQRAIFGPLAVVGRALGYRGWYPDYTSDPLGGSSESER
jgi:quercetin dioxygenase-like cupin family protein